MADDHDIQIHDAWGIGNLRQTAGFPIGNENKYHYVCPVGPLLVIWDIMKKKRVEAKQLVDDLITILHKCEKTKFALLISYSGNGILLSPSLKPLSHFAVPGNNVVYASWSACGKYFCVCNIGHFSSLRLYAIEADGSSAILNWCVKASDIEGLEACATSEDGTHSLEQSGLVDEWQIKDALSSKAGHMDAYYGCVFTDNQKLIAIYKHDRNPCEAHLYSYDGVLLKRCTISPLGEPNTSMLCMSECRKMTCAIGLHRGLFVFIDLENFELKSIFQAQGSAQVCIWEKDLLVTASYQSGLLQWWSVCGDLVKEMEIEKIDSVVHLNWSVLEKELWIGGITSLNYTFFESTESDNKKLSKTVSFFDHTVAGCGLNFKDQFSLATGDLAGNVIINKLGRHSNFHNENRVNVKNSVRCLAWIDDDLFIGTLEGMLFCWQPFKHSEGTQLFNVAHVFDFGVLTLRKANTSNRLAVGTGGGDLFIFDTRSGTCDLVLHRKVHACKAIVDGTGIQPMEIWSLAWDPTDKMIVTASEDQTSIVLSIIKGDQIAKITGHSSAVTSVDWKLLMNRKCILATCADDKTVRINNGETFELLHILNTSEIHGWYTFTYLSINPLISAVLCSSQNGYLVMWDLDSLNLLFCKKLHCGSIEGLEWSKISHNFASVGSDCIVNVASFCSQAEKLPQST